MNVLPLSAMGSLYDEELQSAECSDRLYVPATLFQRHLQTAPVFLTLKNRVEQSTVGRMFAVHSNVEENTIYAPPHILEALDFDLEHVTAEPTPLRTCTQVTLQPFEAMEGLTMELLQESLERYSHIRDGQTLRLWHPHGFEFSIMVQAVEPDAAVSISNCDIPLSMMEPMYVNHDTNSVSFTDASVTDASVTEASVTEASVTEASAAKEAVSTVTEHVAAETTAEKVVTDSIRERIYKAALARQQQSKQVDT
jgi:hypothetical protein